MDLVARPLSGRLDASTRSLRLIPLSRDERLDLESESADLLEVDLISVLLRSTLDDAREDPVPYEDFPRKVDALRVFGALVDLEWFRDDVARCRVSPERLRESLTAPERDIYSIACCASACLHRRDACCRNLPFVLPSNYAPPCELKSVRLFCFSLITACTQ